MTVYLLINTITGHRYVGLTRSLLRDRWQTHKSEAKTRAKWPLHLAIRQYGPECFRVETLAFEDDVAVARRLEEYWIQWYRTTDPSLGYNRSLGFKLSPEARAKMAASRIGIPLTASHRAAVSRGNAGKAKSAAHCAALSAARRRYLEAQREAKCRP